VLKKKRQSFTIRMAMVTEPSMLCNIKTKTKRLEFCLHLRIKQSGVMLFGTKRQTHMQKFDFTLDVRKVYTFDEYLTLTQDLLAQNKTTGSNQSESMIHYTAMNLKRMQRVLKTFKISEELQETIKSIDQPQTWLVLSEAWCGDAAHSVPAIAMLADLNPNIYFKIILRDENLDIMDEFLTRGGRSIPKLIAYDAENKIHFTWGPRPEAAQEVYNVYLNNKETMTYDDIAKDLQLWYSKDRGKSLQEELQALLQSLPAQSV
jgi:hypothetical protein